MCVTEVDLRGMGFDRSVYRNRLMSEAFNTTAIENALQNSK